MPHDWQPKSRFWHQSLAPMPGDDPDSQWRARLRSSLVDARSAVEPIAAAIVDDLPEFTVHDVTHIDALWPLVDLIAPDDLELTPTEVWTLGVAMLLHDLGLALAAYPGGRQQLREATGWPDALAAAVRARVGRPPTPDEIGEPTDDDLEEADRTILRARHADRAAELADAEMAGRRLITDDMVRHGLGELAGRIAASHWWPSERLVQLGATRGAPAGMPAGWKLRPVLLAALLRTGDAAHLDALRAPHERRRELALNETSARHWDFQGRLAQPIRDGTRLRFTSTKAFGLPHAGAWWTCVDHLRILDRELGDADALLSDLGQPRLAVRSVADLRDLQQLAASIRVEGWRPVDTQIGVSDVPHIVATLGGRQLYGDALAVPLRELIQNASDAIRVRQAFEPDYRGRVRVWFAPDLSRIEVHDDGIGMSDGVLTGTLLDFGRSLWSSPELASVHPGLQAAGFQPAGRFGIGFFSTFMWTDDVSVVSRARDAARTETRVLTFAGLAPRPLVRDATDAERLNGSGTIVVLERPQLEDLMRHWITGGFDRPGPDDDTEHEVLLDDACNFLAWLAPALSVDLEVVVGGSAPQIAVTANDWLTLEPEQLLARIESVRGGADRLDDLSDAGRIAARLAIVDAHEPRLIDELGEGPCVLVAGGLRVGTSHEAAGILTVERLNAARSAGVPELTAQEVSRWASSQARRIKLPDSRVFAARVLELGGDPAALHLADSGHGLLSYGDIVTWASSRLTVTLIDAPRAIRLAEPNLDGDREDHVELGESVLDVHDLGRWSPSRSRLLRGVRARRFSEMVETAIAEAWGGGFVETTVGDRTFLTVNGEPIDCLGRRLARPS